jgi:hypothetical protein
LKPYLLIYLPTRPYTDVCLYNYYQICHGCIGAIPILDNVDIAEAYSQIESRYHSIVQHGLSQGWHNASIGQEEDTMEGILNRSEVRLTEAAEISR